MIDLPALAERLNEYGILNKSFMDMTKSEILLMVDAIFSNPDDSVPPEGWETPSIDESGTLHIPFNSHPKYYWWTINGQSIMQTLIELNAPWEVARNYVCNRQITEEVYMNKLIPF
jgi:hypothetical protein